MKKAVVALTLGLFVLCGCAPSSGTVIDKRYSAPQTWTSYDCQYYTTDKGKTRQVCALNTHYQPASWELELRNDSENKTGWRDVDETDYHAYNIGDHYGGN